MDYLRKLKLRLCLSAACAVIGIISIIVYVLRSGENTVFLTFGAAFTAVGAVRILMYSKLIGNPESARARETAENDERNISIVNRAKSLAFGIYTFGAALAVIILEFAGKSALASVIAMTVCSIVFIYWLSYLILQKRS